MVADLRAIDPERPDRGVRTAPFYVLIGANMPSILAEIAFVSQPERGEAAAGRPSTGTASRGACSRACAPTSTRSTARRARQLTGRRLQIYSGLRRPPPLTLLSLLAVENVTWIKVERPVFDLVGVVLSSARAWPASAPASPSASGRALGIGVHRAPPAASPPRSRCTRARPALEVASRPLPVCRALRSAASRARGLSHDALRHSSLTFMTHCVILRPMKAGASPAAERLIRRYDNRKLYDVQARRYVTLEELARLVGGGTRGAGGRPEHGRGHHHRRPGPGDAGGDQAAHGGHPPPGAEPPDPPGRGQGGAVGEWLDPQEASARARARGGAHRVRPGHARPSHPGRGAGPAPGDRAAPPSAWWRRPRPACRPGCGGCWRRTRTRRRHPGPAGAARSACPRSSRLRSRAAGAAPRSRAAAAVARPARAGRSDEGESDGEEEDFPPGSGTRREGGPRAGRGQAHPRDVEGDASRS